MRDIGGPISLYASWRTLIVDSTCAQVVAAFEFYFALESHGSFIVNEVKNKLHLGICR